MRPDRMVLSAYLDGEVPERFVAEIAAAIERDPEVRAEYDELRLARARLAPVSDAQVAASAARSWEAVTTRLAQRASSHPAHSDVWHRKVVIPLPAMAAAAAVLVALAGILVWSVLGGNRTSAEELLANRNDVDVTIRVDGTDMEQVLQWLVSQNMLGEVNIQLPEQQFQIVGEPVFVKPAQYEHHEGDVTQ